MASNHKATRWVGKLKIRSAAAHTMVALQLYRGVVRAGGACVQMEQRDRRTPRCAHCCTRLRSGEHRRAVTEVAGRESETQKTKISAIIRLPIVRACALLAACTRRVAVLWGWKKEEEKREACGGVSSAMCSVRQLRASRSREEECNAG